MNPDQNEQSEDANGVLDSSESAEQILAKLESPEVRLSNKPLKRLQNSTLSSFEQVNNQANHLRNSINKENERISKLAKEEILDEIMLRMEADVKGEGLLSMERIHEIGVCLIENFCSFELTAIELGMTPAKLRYLITRCDELQVYYEVAHAGVKSLTDKQVLEGLRRGEDKYVKMVFNKMYAGRNKGGYNIAELGTIGYDDKLAQKLAAETEADRRQNQVKVEFNFVQKEVRAVHEQIEAVTDAIDGDYEMVDTEPPDKIVDEETKSDIHRELGTRQRL